MQTHFAELTQEGHVPEVAGGRVTRRSSIMQCDTPTVRIRRAGQTKRSIAAKRAPLHRDNAPMPTPRSAENLAENEILNPSEKRADTTKEHTFSWEVEKEVVPPELKKTLSFNRTEIAQMCNENPGYDEAETSSCALATLRGFRVSHELVPVLQKIFDKYGDITKESVSHDPKFLSLLLGELCRTVETLKSVMIHELSFDRLEKMCGNIKAMEMMNLNVGWLQKKLADIKEKKDLIMFYSDWKEKKSKIEKERAKLEAKRTEILVLEEKVRVMEDQHKECNVRIEKAKELFKAICTNNCADGLL